MWVVLLTEGDDLPEVVGPFLTRLTAEWTAAHVGGVAVEVKRPPTIVVEDDPREQGAY